MSSIFEFPQLPTEINFLIWEFVREVEARDYEIYFGDNPDLYDLPYPYNECQQSYDDSDNEYERYRLRDNYNVSYEPVVIVPDICESFEDINAIAFEDFEPISIDDK